MSVVIACAPRAGAGDGAANVQPEVPPGGISVNPLGAGGGRALHTLRRSFFAMAPRRDVEAHNPNAVAHPGEEVRAVPYNHGPHACLCLEQLVSWKACVWGSDAARSSL